MEGDLAPQELVSLLARAILVGTTARYDGSRSSESYIVLDRGVADVYARGPMGEFGRVLEDGSIAPVDSKDDDPPMEIIASVNVRVEPRSSGYDCY
jgi:hypothetical protein